MGKLVAWFYLLFKCSRVLDIRKFASAYHDVVTSEAVCCSNTKPLPSQTTVLADHTIWQRKCLCMQESLLVSLFSQLQLVWILSSPHWKLRNRGHSRHVPQWNQLFAQSHLPISVFDKNEQCTADSKSRTIPEPVSKKKRKHLPLEAVRQTKQVKVATLYQQLTKHLWLSLKRLVNREICVQRKP